VSVEITPMTAEETAIAGLWRIAVKAVTDERGTVREFFRTSGMTELDIPVPDRWQQINVTWTRQGGLRGLHGETATKLVGVAAGAAFGAYLDARPDSPSFGRVVTVALPVGVQMLVPAGVCNGFQAVSDGGCQYLYCFDSEWSAGMAGVAVTPLDRDLEIDWPIRPRPEDPAMVSAKDAAAPRWAEVTARLTQVTR
jgi:dTDP-4-dehydrorhamnose 3,5-epimerase